MSDEHINEGGSTRRRSQEQEDSGSAGLPTLGDPPAGPDVNGPVRQSSAIMQMGA